MQTFWEMTAAEMWQSHQGPKPSPHPFQLRVRYRPSLCSMGRAQAWDRKVI